MSSSYAIETHGLEKEYSANTSQPVRAVCGIDLNVKSGEIYALLGPNGAGKTTTLAMLTTLLTPTRGDAHVAGFDVVSQPAQVRRHIGVTFQEVVLDQDLTGRQVLDFHGQLYGLNGAERRSRITDLADLVELSDVLDRKASGYSGGMKRRLELARGLMTKPTVLFLDEPTQGLNPQNRAGIWTYIRRLRDEGGLTLLLTTHYMEEAEALADRVGIIDHGRLVVEGTPAELVRHMGADVVSITGSGGLDAFVNRTESQDYVATVTHHEFDDGIYQLQVGVDNGDRRLAQIIGLATESAFHVQEISVSRPSLADVFLAYTGRALRDK